MIELINSISPWVRFVRLPGGCAGRGDRDRRRIADDAFSNWPGGLECAKAEA
jgi:hypothetical protein